MCDSSESLPDLAGEAGPEVAGEAGEMMPSMSVWEAEEPVGEMRELRLPVSRLGSRSVTWGGVRCADIDLGVSSRYDIVSFVSFF